MKRPLMGRGLKINNRKRLPLPKMTATGYLREIGGTKEALSIMKISSSKFASRSNSISCRATAG